MEKKAMYFTVEEILNALNVSKDFRIRNENGVYFIE